MRAIMTVVALLVSASAFVHPHQTHDSIYIYGSNSLQTVTVYQSATPNGACVILVHGGGFNSSAGRASKLAVEAGTLTPSGDTVFVVNYRDDMNGVGIADEVSDVVAGTQWVTNNAARFGGHPSDLTMIGGSAGGLLTGDAAEDLNSLHPGTVDTVITLSATEDFATSLTYWDNYPGKDGTHHMKNLTRVLGCQAGGCSSALENAYSPDQQVSSSNCASQWIVFNGTDETQPQSQAIGMDNALVAAGCPQTLDVFPDTAHAFSYWSVVLPQIQSAIAES